MSHTGPPFDSNGRRKTSLSELTRGLRWEPLWRASPDGGSETVPSAEIHHR